MGISIRSDRERSGSGRKTAAKECQKGGRRESVPSRFGFSLLSWVGFKVGKTLPFDSCGCFHMDVFALLWLCGLSAVLRNVLMTLSSIYPHQVYIFVVHTNHGTRFPYVNPCSHHFPHLHALKGFFHAFFFKGNC